MPLNHEATLPQELLDLIVNSISLDSEDGRFALSSCLLVSRSFFWRSRSRLFSHVVLRTYNPLRSQGLRKLLEFQGADRGYPDLIHCIKSFRIICVSLQIETAGEDNDVTAILSILANARIVRALHLESVHKSGLSLFTASRLAVLEIHKICHSPSFEELQLTKIHSTHLDICNPWTIKKLLINPYTTFLDISSTSDPNEQPISMTPSCLRTFNYMFRSLRLLPKEWLESPSPFSSLHNLAVGLDYLRYQIDDEAISQLNKILHLSSTTLQTLTIRLDNPERLTSSDHSISLRNLSALRELRFNIAGIHFARALGGTQDVRVTLLSFDPVPTTLDRIVIFYNIVIERSTDVGFESDSDWQNLGDVLVSKRFESVKRIEVVLLATFKRLDYGRVESPPFLDQFPAVWQSKYPRIPFTIYKVDQGSGNQALYDQIISS